MLLILTLFACDIILANHRLLALLEDPSWKSQVTKHHAEAKTIGIAAVPIDQGDVLGAQGVVANHPAFIARGGIENEPLRLGE